MSFNGDYLDIIKKFKDYKDVADYIDDVEKLRIYYYNNQYELMREHINKLTLKYFKETITWNTTHPYLPVTYHDSYNNAEFFLRVQGIKLIHDKLTKHKGRLSNAEVEFVDYIISLM